MDEKKEQKILEKVLLASVVEYRRSRRWRIFFALLFFIYLGFVTISTQSFSLDSSSKKSDPHIAQIEIQDPILSSKAARAILDEFNKAVENDSAKAIFLRINSPGGTTFQSKMVFLIRKSTLLLKISVPLEHT